MKFDNFTAAIVVILTREPDDPSLDDLVGTGKDRRRDRQPERLCGLQVDDKFEPGRLLNRQIGGSGALEDLVDECGGALRVLSPCLSIGQEAAAFNELPPLVNRRQSVLRCERDDTTLIFE